MSRFKYRKRGARSHPLPVSLPAGLGRLSSQTLGQGKRGVNGVPRGGEPAAGGDGSCRTGWDARAACSGLPAAGAEPDAPRHRTWTGGALGARSVRRVWILSGPQPGAPRGTGPRQACRLGMEPRDRDLRGPIGSDGEARLALLGAHSRNLHEKGADRVGLEPLPGRAVPLQARPSDPAGGRGRGAEGSGAGTTASASGSWAGADEDSRPAAGACEAEGEVPGLLFETENRRVRAHRSVGRGLSLAPLLDRGRAEALAARQSPCALLPPAGSARRTASVVQAPP